MATTIDAQSMLDKVLEAHGYEREAVLEDDYRYALVDMDGYFDGNFRIQDRGTGETVLLFAQLDPNDEYDDAYILIDAFTNESKIFECEKQTTFIEAYLQFKRKVRKYKMYRFLGILAEFEDDNTLDIE